MFVCTVRCAALLPVVALMIGGEMVMVAARRGGHRGCHRCATRARCPQWVVLGIKAVEVRGALHREMHVVE
jgi:hypothetical protein